MIENIKREAIELQNQESIGTPRKKKVLEYIESGNYQTNRDEG